MVQKGQRQSRRSDQEWLDLIQDCRTSGMSDKDWWDLHHIKQRLLIRYSGIVIKSSLHHRSDLLRRKLTVLQINLTQPIPDTDQCLYLLQ